MKKLLAIIVGAAAMAIPFSSCKKESKIEMNFPDKFEGKTVELISFADSVVLASAVVNEGHASFLTQESDSVKFPLFTQIVIDGRVRAYYILEKGNVELADSMSVPRGTPLNEQFAAMMATLDSIENLDDMKMYVDFVEQKYNENKESAFGPYLGVEWLKYAEPQKVDSFLNKASESFRSARRVAYYKNFADHRAKTAPGMKFTDFAGENATGKKIALSDFVKPGQYTLIDFWASWCPYCIKELPELIALYNDFHDKGFNIVGVAVRDKTEDTKAMVEKKEIPWDIMYNTQKVPYDIYGFSGIPHHILLDADGVIVSRGENASQIRTRLEELNK